MERIDYSKRARLGFFIPGRPNLTDGYRKVGRVRRMDVWVDNDMDHYMGIEVTSNIDGKHKRVMCMDLEQQGQSWHVNLVQVDSMFQGMGIAPMVYRYICKKLGIMLQAGHMQSPGGRHIWNMVSTYKDMLVLGQRGKKGKLYPLEQGPDGELVSDRHKVYDGGYNYHVFCMYSK